MMNKLIIKLCRVVFFRCSFLLVATIAVLVSHSLAASSPTITGAATLIRPSVGQLTFVQTTITGVLLTNVSLVPVGRIPVLATNIDFQLVVTTASAFSAFYNTLILTNATGGPNPPIDFAHFDYVCTDIQVTNVFGFQTNITTIGSVCNSLVSNNTTVIYIVTNSIPADIQYYTIATTNVFFNPLNPLCWQTIYYTNLTVTSQIGTNVLTTECGHPLAGSSLGYGMLKLTEKNQTQTVSLKAVNIIANPLTPPAGMAVFMGNSICDNASFTNLGLMSLMGTNNVYTFTLGSSLALPFPLGVTNLNELAGKLIQICDQATNIYLQVVIPPLVATPTKLSYTHKVNMVKPVIPPSKKAAGVIRASFTGTSGRSVFEVRVTGLTPGNTYTISLVGTVTETYPLINRTLSFDTAKGNELPFGVTTVSDLTGIIVEIRDAFGTLHLSGSL